MSTTVDTGTAGGNGQAPTTHNENPANPASSGEGAAGNQGGNGQAPTAGENGDVAARLAVVEQELSEARREAAKYRTEGKKGTEAEATVQTLQGDLQALRKELAHERSANALTTAAQKAGALYPDAVIKLVDIASVADETGKVANPDKVMTELKKSYPALFGASAPAGGADGGAGSRQTASDPNDMNAAIRARRQGSRVR